MRAFPKCIHKGLGSSECYCPNGSDFKKDEYDQMRGNIAISLSDAPLILSEVAVRKNLIMHKGDSFHHERMADNIEVMVQMSQQRDFFWILCEA